MNISRTARPSGSRAGLSIIIALFLGLFVLVAHRANAASPGDGERLVTIYDGATEQTVVTTARTVGEALKRAEVRVDPLDAVEPAADTELVASAYSVNIYRARPVTVIDGPLRRSIISPYQSAKKVAESAQIAVYDEDNLQLDLIDDFVGEDGFGLKLTIDRAVPFTFELYGKTTEARTQAATVGEMLKEKNVTLGPNDGASLPLDTPVTAGMSIRVWRDGVQTVTEEQPVAFPVRQIKDTSKDVSYKEIQSPGTPGKKLVTYEINLQQGKETSRKEIQSVVVAEPKEQVEIVGTKLASMPYTGGGTKTEWLAASRIPQPSWGAADYIVSQESRWNPNATNRSSGACGLAQALPCSKVPGNPYDPVNSLNWMHGYVIGRYGSWENAVSFKRANGWY